MSSISLRIINLSLSLSSKRKPLQNLISVSQYALVDDQKTEARHIESLLRILLFLIISCSLQIIYQHLCRLLFSLNLSDLSEFYSKKLTQSGLFPKVFEDGVLNWKISFGILTQTDAYPLHIKNVSFSKMPLQYEVNPQKPQNIEYGRIMQNGVKVYDGWMHYTADTFDELYYMIEYEPKNDIKMISWFL